MQNDFSSKNNEKLEIKRSWKRRLGGRRLSPTAHLVEPFKQIKFGFYVIGVCFFYLTLLTISIWWAVKELYGQVTEWFGVASEAQPDLFINDVSTKVGMVIGCVLLMFIVTMLVVVIKRTHRMYGPMVNIENFLTALESGNYSTRLRIREKDDFQNIADKLNKLAITLHERHGLSFMKNAQPSEDDIDDDFTNVSNPNDKID